MKKSISFKSVSVLLISVLLLTFCLCGCGGAKDDENNPSKIAGKTETWGNITIVVPDGMTLEKGDLLDDNNKDALSLQDSKEVFRFIMVAIRDEESIDMGMEMTKEMNTDATFKDVEIKLDNGTFTGYAYTSEGVECIQLKGKIGDKFVQIGTDAFTSDDEILKGVLASIVLK